MGKQNNKGKWNLFSGIEEGSLATEYQRLYSHYRNIALNLYTWENLPNGIESRHIEEALYRHGQVFFYEDKTLGLMCLPCSSSGTMNVYGEPTRLNVVGIGYNQMKNASEGIRILNNDSALPTHSHINHYAKKMAEIDDIMTQNLRQQRFPYVFSTTKQNEFSIKQMFKKIYEGAQAVFIDKDMMSNSDSTLRVLSTESPYLLDRLQIQKAEYEREMLTFLGLNSTVQKKERLIVDEANANNSYIDMSLNLGLKTRQRAVDLINEKFGLNITVTATIYDLESVAVQEEVTEWQNTPSN